MRPSPGSTWLTRGRLVVAMVSSAALVCCASLVTGAPATTRAAATPPSAPAEVGGPDDKIAPEVIAALGRSPATDVWVRLKADADTSSARSVPDRTTRGRQVVDALKRTAEQAQPSVRRVLDARGLHYRSYWVTNAIQVEAATASVTRELARLDVVAEVRAPQQYQAPEPVEVRPAGMTPSALEWGLANINADDVWSQLGARGEGIVVASIDTGAQFDHPALVGAYRGNNGDGTFDHDYNWFDPAAACEGEPCDTNGHGTHTMGTMAGDDGSENKIGVAPGVRWITANGCCPTDAALLASSEWMLEPTDLNGENGDVSKRPHIVNNSWGSSDPSNDPFLEDIQRAWADSGIFGVWANGNDGPGCRTSGTPGSRTLNYSVGAYDSSNLIADFSARGPGQDGEVKPNISAPGRSVRSSYPGSTYQTMSGTSMAAPHVAGSIALLWSAQPTLVRDVATTRALLDLSAIDTADDQCGGDAADNNVYGEGRLDALALLRLASTGIGTLSGTITDAATGQALPGAEIAVSGAVERRTTAGSDGTYTLVLGAGDYQLTVGELFGYPAKTTPVTVTAGQTTRHDVALAPTSRVSVTGVVRDGSGQGWPLHAKVVASHASGFRTETVTDPVTGGYRLSVVADSTYTVRTTAVGPGYIAAQQVLAVGTGDLVNDVSLRVHPACTADGYQPRYDGQTQTFDHNRPVRWQVTNLDRRYPGYEHQPGWTFTDPGARGNTTGATGGFAIVDSDHYGQHHVQDTRLTTPAVDMSGHEFPAVEFATDLRPAVNATATLELSTDAGRTWTTAWTSAGFPGARGPGTQVVLLPAAAGKAQVKVRFHYTGQWSGWWAVDNVFIGDRTCEPTPGGRRGQVPGPAVDISANRRGTS